MTIDNLGVIILIVKIIKNRIFSKIPYFMGDIVENFNKYKGQNEGIVLFILSKKDFNTDELKIVFDDTFFEIKIGTLYSVLTRLKDKKAISEFRISSKDGFRRKIYKITPAGEKLFNKSYKELFEDVYIDEKYLTCEQEQFISKPTEEVNPTKNEKVVASDDVKTEKNTEIAKENNYENYIQDGLSADFNEYTDLDSIFDDNSPKQENIEEVNHEEFAQSSSKQIETSVQDDIEPQESQVLYPNVYSNFSEHLDADSKIKPKYEYKGVLNKLYPKQQPTEEVFEEVEVQEITTTNNINQNQPKTTNSIVEDDWIDAYQFAKKEGVKIRTSSDTNRYSGSKILINRLRFFTSLITLILASFEYLLLTTVIKGLTFDFKLLLPILIVYGTIFVISSLALIFAPMQKVKDLNKFINSFEIALILTISTIIIAFSIAVIKPVDFTNINEIFTSIIYPTIYVINLPIFVIIEHSLKKLDFFLTI